MNFSIDNGLSRYSRLFVVIMFVFCGGAVAQSVDDAWAASPATNDTQWAQINAAPVNPGHSGGSINTAVGYIAHGGQIPLPSGWTNPARCQWTVANSSQYHHGKPFYYAGGVATVDGNRIVTCGFRDDWNFYASGTCAYAITCN